MSTTLTEVTTATEFTNWASLTEASQTSSETRKQNAATEKMVSHQEMKRAQHVADSQNGICVSIA